MLRFKYGDRIVYGDVNGRAWYGKYIQEVGYNNAVVRLDEGVQCQAVHFLTLAHCSAKLCNI